MGNDTDISTPPSMTEKISVKIFTCEKRNEVIKRIVKRDEIKQIKSEDEQYIEQARDIVKIVPISNCIPIVMHSPNADKSAHIEGSAVKHSPCKCTIFFQDQRERLEVDEKDLLNPLLFQVKRPDMILSSGQSKCKSRKIKRISKQTEEDIVKMKKVRQKKLEQNGYWMS